MKTVVQLFISAAAAGTLLASVASHATDISELPLKAGVLAKPNVVFAMDDSGSMDSELMINGTFQGWFYGNYGTTPLYPGNLPRTGSASWDWNMLYLFPNGTGTGNKVYADPSTAYGYAVPPTAELAWTRSADYNSMYYDSAKTYKPWSPAYVSGATVNYTDAAPGAARSHPALGSTTMALNANLTSSSTDWKFTFTVGMTIPTGATNMSCLWGSTPAAAALPYAVPTSNGLCMATVTYYPATFWRKESCTADGTTCVTNYDSNTLKRYEIKAGNTYPSGRTYTAEIQNFANWFTYYRKRRLMLGASMGQVLESITGLRMGVVAFNAQAAPTMYDSDATSASLNRLAVVGRFYTAEGSGGTPTHGTMAYIYNQFDTNTNIIQYACQNNAQFIITDGFANDSTSAPPSYSTATYGAAAPFQAITGSSLHDKALAYYTLRLRSVTSALPAGRVPVGPQSVSNPDNNTNLHLNTYGLTLGMKGSIWPSATDPFVTAPTWPVPVSNTATMIDDLWHATINGRGQMYLATDATATAAGIQAGLADILSQVSAQSGVAVSTVNLVRGDSRAYFGQYNPSGWTGDVAARAVNSATGVVDTTQIWSASTLLTARDWTTRVIASYDGTSGVGFTAAAVGTTVNPANVYGTTSQVMDYLRGDPSNEGTLFRKRVGLMGAVINSEPYISNDDGVLYVASGEGMLHAIDIKTSGNPGKELWAFVPRQALVDIGSTTARSYSFKTQLDGSPTVASIASGAKKILVAGMGAAAGGFFALDVTTPRSLNESTLASKVMWDFPTAGDSATQAKVGQALGRPVIAKTTDDGDVVLVTSGYNSTADGKGRLWMLNANTGAVITEFVVPAGTLASESGLAHVTAFDEGDGTARYAYGGDLLGNLWRFDLKAKTVPDKVAVLTGPGGQAQAVTTSPELAKIDGNRVIIMPTGRILGITDFGNNLVQSIYAIKDGATLDPARSSLVVQTYTRATDSISGASVDWATQRGWYMDLPAGEHGNTRPSITYGGVAFVTNVNGGTDCSASSYLYLLDVKTGAKYAGSSFIGSQISAVAGATSVTTVVTTDGKARGLVQDYNGGAGAPKTWNPPAILPSKTAWREVRRQ